MEHEQILTYVSPFIFFLWISLLVLTIISLWHQSSIADKIKIIKECSEEDKFRHLDYAIIRLLELHGNHAVAPNRAALSLL